MSHDKDNQSPKCGCKSQQKKTATNNQWTNAHTKEDADRRERRDGPGGDCGCGR